MPWPSAGGLRPADHVLGCVVFWRSILWLWRSTSGGVLGAIVRVIITPTRGLGFGVRVIITPNPNPKTLTPNPSWGYLRTIANISRPRKNSFRKSWGTHVFFQFPFVCAHQISNRASSSGPKVTFLLYLTLIQLSLSQKINKKTLLTHSSTLSLLPLP